MENDDISAPSLSIPSILDPRRITCQSDVNHHFQNISILFQKHFKKWSENESKNGFVRGNLSLTKTAQKVAISLWKLYSKSLTFQKCNSTSIFKSFKIRHIWGNIGHYGPSDVTTNDIQYDDICDHKMKQSHSKTNRNPHIQIQLSKAF